MKTQMNTLSLLLLAFLFLGATASGQDAKPEKESMNLYQDGKYQPYKVLDTRIDNMKYWKKAAALGLTETTPYREIPPGTFKSTKIEARSVRFDDSPDVQVTDVSSTQSENSIFVDPTDPDRVLQSNNSTQNPVGSLYGANYFFSYDFGETWGGSVQGAGGSNSGDPATAIGLGGRQYVGFIHSNSGQGVAYSDDGVNWTSVVADAGSGSSLLDKNHMWIDNSPDSPYEGYVYSAWTDFGGPNDTEIEIVKSIDDGISYSTAVNISSAINAGSHNQGVNIQTGPNGEVYVVWAVYDSWPSDESALGFTKSTNGGTSFQTATRIISNIRGIRTSETSKNHRVNSFPSMAVDISNGPNRGNIYIVWTNIGVPGTNTGSDIDVYMIRSTDSGSSWSSPIRINQDESGLGNEHYFPWITCDPENGVLSVIFYDDRNVGGAKCEVFCANSFDGGDTWEDFRVSDVDFTPTAISGLADDYMGDYLGISARGGKVYPVWTDNRSGEAMTYTSPYQTNVLPRPENLTGNVIFATGQVNLDWDFTTVSGFEYFVVYRDNTQLGTTTDLTFTDFLPDYGVYNYEVTAMHTEGESASTTLTLQWGNPQVDIDPESIIENLQPGGSVNREMTITNTGQLPLTFSVSSSTEPLDGSKDYCTPTIDCSYGDGFETFIMAEIDNSGSGCSNNGYGDFTSMTTELQAGETYDVSFQSGYNNQNVCLWIDFDKNETFDADELLLDDYNLANADQLYTTQVTIPEGVDAGTTRMRIKANWINSAGDPCESTSYGETEDYTVNISGWLFVDNISGTIDPGNAQEINVLLDATDLEQGTYNGNINVTSDDPDAPSVDVPVTLTVANLLPLNLEVQATPTTITEGESTQLNATATGGSGNYTFAWTSDPAGFTADIPNPVAFPAETTIYFCEISDGNETASGQVTVTVESAQVTQSIDLGEGWNIFSSSVMPDNPDMLEIVQPIIDEDLLYKVIDENGGNIFFLPFPAPGQWNNSIGEIAETEGYYIKVHAATSLSLTGYLTELPLDIPLTEGWNMISFPAETPQDALAVVQPLIDADVLYKVIDQEGGVILHLPFPEPNGQWSNTVGNFEAGQGYYIKVTADATLTIGEPADDIQNSVPEISTISPTYFNTVWSNNPYQPMTIAVKAADWLEPGDEIAVYDNDICVGATVYKGIQDDAVLITVGMDAPETEMIDGATAGNNFSFKLWNRNGNMLYENIYFEYLQGSLTYNGLETSIVELNPILTQLSSISRPVSLSLHPNPTNNEAILDISVPGAAKVTVNIVDGMGNIKTLPNGNQTIENSGQIKISKDGLNLAPGVYTLQVILEDRHEVDPITKLMKFVVY